MYLVTLKMLQNINKRINDKLIQVKLPEGICLYHQAAILCIDGSNDLHLLVEDDKIFVYLINKDTKRFIPPTIASTVQECLTLTFVLNKNINSRYVMFR
jgi:hypothetical protein